MDRSLKVLLIALSIIVVARSEQNTTKKVPVKFIAVARSEQNSTKKIPVKSGHLLLDYNWPRIKTGLSRLPHRSSCHHFYSLDSEGQFKLRKCPTGHIFDYRALKCGRQTLSQCWSSQFDSGYKPVYHRKHFHCPLPWGKYPDILNCKRYFQCRAKKALHRTCPSSTLFDKTKSRCVPQTLAICSDKAEVEKYYKCPRSRGLFMYSKDCSKYHKCRQRVSKLRSCKLGYLFDHKSSKCLPKDEVVCGSRYNPYNQSDETSTTSSSVRRTTATQRGSSQNFLMETSQNTKTPELSTNMSTELPDVSFEISDESSSDEHLNSTAHIVTDDSEEDLHSRTNDTDISSSSEEQLVKELSSSQEFIPRTAETELERLSTSMARATDDDFLGVGLVTDSSNSSAETEHKNSSEDISPGTAGVANVSTDVMGTTDEIHSQNKSKRTSETPGEKSSEVASTGTARGSSFEDISSEKVHSGSSIDFPTEEAETVPFVNEIPKYKVYKPEDLQEEPLVKVISIKRSA